jgi:CHASE3 domain sensor protein
MSDQSATAKISEEVRRHADKLLALSAVLLILIGTIFYGAVEDWSWVDSFYFSVVAVSTVGFGDLTPSTDGSKLFTVFYVLSGISIISLWLNERLRHHARTTAQRRQGKRH